VRKITAMFFILLLINTSLHNPKLHFSALKNTDNTTFSKTVQISWNKYHNYSEVTSILKKLNESYSEIVKLYSIGKTLKSRDIWCIELSSQETSKPKPALFIVSYHHTRERITIEVALYIAWYLATNYATNDTIKEILEKTVIYIIPALNADGIEVSEMNSWQRKNLHPIDEDGDGKFDEDPPNDLDKDGKIYCWWNATYMGFEGIDDDNDGLINEDWLGGVDLNRNYDFHWNDTNVESGSSDPHSEIYIGPRPFSELETQAIKNFVEQHDNIKYALSFHSGIVGILYPWGYTQNPPPDEEKFISLAKNMSEVSGYPYYQSGRLYTCSGEWGDWMYGVHRIFAFTVEVYGQGHNNTWWTEHVHLINDRAYFYDVWEYFNPPEDEIKIVLEKNLRITLFLATKLITGKNTFLRIIISVSIISIVLAVIVIVKFRRTRLHQKL